MASKILVSEIQSNPSRSVNLGEAKGWVTLSAGIKVVFDPPVKFGSKELTEGWDQIGKEVISQYNKQWEPYKTDKKGGKSDN